MRSQIYLSLLWRSPALEPLPERHRFHLLKAFDSCLENLMIFSNFSKAALFNVAHHAIKVKAEFALINLSNTLRSHLYIWCAHLFGFLDYFFCVALRLLLILYLQLVQDSLCIQRFDLIKLFPKV
eukprot:Blabericola_migrator_1__12960@NODE_858_length_6240_cov_61_647821_g608_i0_p6_GENE_NODE_858_length_6240_cov_61_647821_g608_i0NODE_858_length_6240_cov_61_647821_g608_i0_p6_ORF_typecomplete_len125_score19_97DUF2153/PF09921_9/0_059_NODE_858_length_6240_cov_61_647821_g608_i0584958